MNKIIEINEKNMYAVVEPYVTSAQLQAELFKRGLNTNMKGAGSQCSAMLRGHGHLDQSMGADDRNHLAVEWVTPEGEHRQARVALARTESGSAATGRARPLRSIIQSTVPPSARPGVFTKVAMKVYHWAGPGRYRARRQLAPNYTLSEKPANMMAPLLQLPHLGEDVGGRDQARRGRDLPWRSWASTRPWSPPTSPPATKRRWPCSSASPKRCRAPASW